MCILDDTFLYLSTGVLVADRWIPSAGINAGENSVDLPTVISNLPFNFPNGIRVSNLWYLDLTTSHTVLELFSSTFLLSGNGIRS